MNVISKEECKKLFGADAKNGAMKLCGIGVCICEYHCGHSNKRNRPATGFVLPTDICPLAEYNITPKSSKDSIEDFISGRNEPTDEEFFAMCACCDNTEVDLGQFEYTARQLVEPKCFSCPVHMAKEAIEEMRAESQLS